MRNRRPYFSLIYVFCFNVSNKISPTPHQLLYFQESPPPRVVVPDYSPSILVAETRSQWLSLFIDKKYTQRNLDTTVKDFMKVSHISSNTTDTVFPKMVWKKSFTVYPCLNFHGWVLRSSPVYFVFVCLGFFFFFFFSGFK